MILAGLILIGISVDKIFNKDRFFLLTGLGLGLLINARYLETVRQDE
jgi:F0F1-type ATP synthase assembly protein I